MQYKDSPKIMIDERKLEILFRLGCPDTKIIELLKTKTFTPTGDKLIDDTLECLIDCKQFDNRGGNHNPSGKNQYTKTESGQSGQNNRSKDRSKTGQTTDKDIELEYNNNIYNIPGNNIQDNNKLSGINNNIYTTRANEEKTKENFDIFWESYTPVKASDGYVVAKGSKKVAFEKYSRIIKSGVKPEDILKGLKAYIDFCQKNNRLTCGVPVFLNQERWKDEYNTPTVIAQTPLPRMSFKEMKEYQNNIEIQKILNGEK